MNLIYIGITHAFSFNEVSHLKKNIFFDPKYIVHDLNEAELKKFRKNNIEYQSISDALVLNNNEKYNKLKYKIDKRLYQFVNNHKDIIDPMFKRFEYSPGSFSKKEKNDYIKKSVDYWYSIIKEKKINLIFHLESPHRIYDFIIYLISKYLKIPNMWFRDPNLNGKYFIEHDYFESPSDLNKCYLGKINKKKIQILIKNKSSYKYLKYIKKDKILFNIEKIKKKHARISNKNYNNNFFRFYIDYLFSKRHPITNKNFKNLKIKNKNFNYEMIGLRYVLWNIKNIFKTLVIKKYYKIISDKNILKDNFCIFFMSYQPEATSYPDAWNMHDQFRIIEKLVKNIPNNYQLAIKEHPTQLNLSNSFFYKNPQIRNIDFYYKIKKKFKDKVIFLDETFDFNSCKKNPKFIATINGSVGLESVIKNIPTITFGHSWYQGCEGVYNINDIKNLKKFILSKKFRYIDKKKIELFINEANRIAIPIYYKSVQKEYYPYYKKLTKDNLLNNLEKLMTLGLRLSKKKYS